MYTIVSHLDTLLNFFDKDNEYIFSEDNDNFHVDLVKMKEGNIKIAVFAIFVEPGYKSDRALYRTLEILDKFLSLIEDHEELKIIKNYQDIKMVIENDKIGIMLSIEGAEGIRDLSILRIMHRLGVRMISLTWNQRNHLADGVLESQTNGGLSLMGRKMLAQMEALDIIIDVSHISEAGFWDIMKYFQKPVLASHSNVMSICPHPRNLADEQIIALTERNGVIGINFAPFFITDRKKVDINDIIKHIDYIRDLVGIESVILGTDYDGIQQTPIGLENISCLKNLKLKLYENDYSREEIEKIFYKNALNFFEKFWGVGLNS
ncbi:MAG: dipeptidase [Halanaerobiales bacterium]